jgi:Uma2 family endonuclease
MSHVVFDTLNRKQFLRLPKADPPLEYREGLVVQEGNGRIIYRGMTLQQFLRLPEAKPALEYVEGMVVQKVSPKTRHSVLQAELLVVLRSHGRSRKLGRPYPELRCTFGGRSLVPDLSFFAHGRIPKDTSGMPVDDVFLAPELAIEIISPGQTIKNLSARAQRCVINGVVACWVIQPTRRQVHVFRRGQPPETLELGDTLEEPDVLPGSALALEELFGWLYED